MTYTCRYILQATRLKQHINHRETFYCMQIEGATRIKALIQEFTLELPINPNSDQRRKLNKTLKHLTALTLRLP